MRQSPHRDSVLSHRKTGKTPSSSPSSSPARGRDKTSGGRTGGVSPSGGGGSGGSKAMASAAKQDPSGSSGAGLQSLVYRSDAAGKAEASAQPLPPSTATASGAPAGGDSSDDEPRGCLYRLCRCFYGKPQSAVTSTDDGRGSALLPPLRADDAGKKCLVLDLDETLVHSSFKPIPKPDYIIPVEIEGTVHHVYVRRRPGCDLFLRTLAKDYEIVVFTASLSKYADPLLDKLDTNKVIRTRLFREHCVYHMGNYVKDMTQLGRPIEQCIIVDNSPASYLFQPENALPCETFIEDPGDRELYEMVTFLQSIASVKDVRSVLHQWCSPGPGTVLGPDPVSGVGHGRLVPSDDGCDGKSDPG